MIYLGDNLKYNSIISDIESNNIRNLYLFYGSETILIRDMVLKIKNKLIDPDFESLNFIKLDGSNLDYDALINACETLPFMNGRKVVVIEDCQFFKHSKNEKGSRKGDYGNSDIAGYLGRIPETTVLILVAGTEVDKRTRIYNAIKKNGDITEFGMLKDNELVSWIVNGFKRMGKKISPSDALHLTGRISGNLEDIQNEMNKLASYVGEGTTVTRQDIDTVVHKSLEMNIFQLVDSVSAKSPGSALIILNELLLDGEPIPVVLVMIARQYRLLLNSKLLLKKGYSRTEIAKKLALKPYIASKMIQLSNKYSEAQIECRLRKCLDADAAIKTGTMDQRTAVEMLIVDFAKQ